MKMEFVEEQLKEWGEIIIHTAGGSTFELHMGDTKFDYDKRMIHLKASDAQFVIDGDEVEAITKHYGHRDGGD